MPKFPDYADKISKIPGAVFEKYRKKMDAYGSGMVRLHIGDTYLPPVYSLPLKNKFLKEHQNFNRYCNTFGIDELRNALKDKLRDDNNLRILIDNILITAGATNALSAAVHSLLNNDEDILVLTPCWPIFRGLVQSVPANIIEVPLYMQLYKNPAIDIIEHLEKYLTKKSVAIYLNTPNNPSGKVLSRQQLEQIAQFARANDLWVISDEAYEGLTFDGREHISIATLEDMYDQTISIFTFSKIFMFAGLRLGYAVGREEVIINLNKIMVHQLYSPPTITQQMMIGAVMSRHQWMKGVKIHYQELRDRFVDQLELPIDKPEAAYFIFFPIQKYLRGRDFYRVIDTLLENGVSVAPGEDFGKGFETYIRLCITGEKPHRLEKGIARVRDVLLKKN